MLNFYENQLNYISKNELYGILDTMPFPIILTETDKTIRYANKEALQLGGYDVLAGKKCYDTFCRKMVCNCPVSASEKISENRQDFFTQSGKTIPVLKKAQPVQFKADLFFAQFFTDLTPQIEEEIKLKTIIAEKEAAKLKAENEIHKFEQLFEGVSEAIIVHDFNGNIIKTNQKAKNWFGYTAGEFKSLNIKNIVAPDFREQVRPRISRLKQNSQIMFESVHRSKNGQNFPVEVSANIANFDGRKVIMGIVRDITSRKKIENELLQAKQVAEHNETELETIFNKVPSTIIMFDENTRILRINQKGSLKFNIDEEEVKNKKIGGVLNCANASTGKTTCGTTEKCFQCTLLKYIRSTITDGIEYNKKELNLNLNEDNQIVKHTVLLSTAILGKNGNSRYIATIDDISDRKKMETELVLAKEKAEVSEKLKSAFLNNISHEIRTPLNGLLGFLDFFEEDMSQISPEERQLFIRTMRQSGDRLMHTVEDIVETSKLDSGIVEVKKEQVKIGKVKEILEKDVSQKYADSNVKFQCLINPDLMNCEVKTDESKLLRILENLVGNAFKFTQHGNITFRVSEKENQVLFTVSDTGIGIDKCDQAVIFEPFRQLDIRLNRAFDGNGLGLTIAQKMVKLLGSELIVQSEKGKGSHFLFALPIFIGDAAEIQGTKVKTNGSAQPMLSGKKILIAEDDETNYLFLEAVLQKEGCSLIRARNGKEAIEQFQRSKDIHLIIMDLKMPVMNGIDATFRIKAIDSSIPIVAHSAYVLNNEKEQSLAAGCAGYIPKPVKKEELIDVVKMHIS